MQELLQALEGFLIGSIPTIILFLLLWFLYAVLVHRPLRQALKERYERTEGAMARARSDIAAADARTHEYEQKLRHAKLVIFKEQEARRKQLAASRDAAIAEARTQAQDLVRKNREELEKQLSTSRAQLDQQADALAAEVIRTVLRPVAAEAGGGA